MIFYREWRVQAGFSRVMYKCNTPKLRNHCHDFIMWYINFVDMINVGLSSLSRHYGSTVGAFRVLSPCGIFTWRWDLDFVIIRLTPLPFSCTENWPGKSFGKYPVRFEGILWNAIYDAVDRMSSLLEADLFHFFVWLTILMCSFSSLAGSFDIEQVIGSISAKLILPKYFVRSTNDVSFCVPEYHDRPTS